MRRVTTFLACLAAGLACAAMPASAAPLRSDNVELLTKLPEAAGAIGARFSPDGKHMYVTAAKGLHVYDVSDPADPQRTGFLPLPHFENEDVDSGNGVVLITNDPSFSTVGMLYVVDVSDPTAPRLRSATPTRLPGAAVRQALGQPGTGNGHIANCIQGCRYAWVTGTAEGISVYDLQNLDAPKSLGTFEMPRRKLRPGENAQDVGPGFTHDVAVDPSGIAWITGEDGTFGYRTDGDPLKPALVYRSDEDLINSGNSGPSLDGASANDYPLDFLHHNSLRTSLALGKRKRPRTTRTRMGDVLAVTEEDYARPGCEGQGSVQTWQITGGHNSDGTVKLKMLDMWTTELNELASATGRSPATGNCSAHWFDENRGLLAQGWYDQGVRFMDISNPRDIRQVGYYASTGTFWAAYFAPSDPKREIVYGLDTAGGVDVLRIDRSGKMPTRTEPAAAVRAQLARTRTVAAKSPEWRFACAIPLV